MAARKRQLEWTAAALAEFAEAMNYYAERNPKAARRMTDEILNAAELLIAEPIATPGRPGRAAGTSERIIGRRTPFVIVYRELTGNAGVVQILRIIHHARKYP